MSLILFSHPLFLNPSPLPLSSPRYGGENEEKTDVPDDGLRQFAADCLSSTLDTNTQKENFLRRSKINHQAPIKDLLRCIFFLNLPCDIQTII